MITNIWLKSQPTKKISYPDCFPMYQGISFDIINYNNRKIEAYLTIASIKRIEFRP